MADRPMEYPVVIEPNTDDEGGYFATFPDLPGCIGDGDTPAAALADALLALAAWMEVQDERGAAIPAAGASMEEAQEDYCQLIAERNRLQDELEKANARIALLERGAPRWSAMKVRSISSSRRYSGSWPATA